MYLGTCISCIICTCILYHMYLCLYLYHICTCMACILPNCWDCSQSESRTQSRPKAVFLPSIRKSTESLAKVIVLSLAVTSFSKRGLPQSISPEKSLIHQMSFGCLAASEISRVGKFFQSFQSQCHINFSQFATRVDESMKGRGLLLLGVPTA